MKNKIKCPKCNEVIINEKFDFRRNKNTSWYKFEKTNMHCPHCGVRLKYDSKTQMYIYFLGVAFLLSIILTLLKILPIFSIFISPFILARIFWKIRRICIHK